jgi:hypothetical protein
VPGHEVVLRVVAVGGAVTSAVVGGRYVVQANFRDHAAKRLYFVGTSGSAVADMRAVLDKAADGRLDTNLPVGAVGGMAGALDGLDAVRDRRIPGKVVVYPALDDLPLLDLGELVARYPGIGPLLSDGCWTGEAERELFRLAAGR